MMQSYTVEELPERYAEVAATVEQGNPVYLTNRGQDSLVVISRKTFAELTSDVETRLDEADYEAVNNPMRLSHREVFSSLRSKVYG